jgi:protein gp37
MQHNPTTRCRFAGLTTDASGAIRWTGTVRPRQELLEQPLRWKKPRVVFVCSMSDLFHPAVPEEFIDAVHAVMAMCYRHTFLVLTKRRERMAGYLTRPVKWSDVLADAALQQFGEEAWAYVGNYVDGENFPPGAPAPPRWPLPNVYYGVSAWNQTSLAEARRHLLRIPARRWISLEPVLGRVDFDTITCGRCDGEFTRATSTKAFKLMCPHCYHCDEYCEPKHAIHRGGALAGIDWLVLGAESGAGRRARCGESQAREARDACQAAGTRYYLKQMDVHKPAGRVVKQVLVTQPALDGRQWLEVPWKQ